MILTITNYCDIILAGQILDDTAATKWHILKLKCIKFDFSWGSAPDPRRGGSLQCTPDTTARFKGPISKGRRGEAEEMGWKGKGRGSEGRERRKGPCLEVFHKY